MKCVITVGTFLRHTVNAVHLLRASVHTPSEGGHHIIRPLQTD